jgi:hypothetical protein
MRLSRFGFATLTLIATFGTLIGCGKADLDEGGELCRTDTDCGADELCEPLSAPKLNPNVAAPCVMTFVPCTDSAGCAEGQACWPSSRVAGVVIYPNCFPPPQICAAACPTTPCLADEVCESSGECRQTACDEEGAVACPEHWQCDPAAAANEPNTYAAGTSEPDSPNYTRDIARGCARLRCDEPGGFTCKESWVCAPESATDPSGCAPLPCTEAGHCSDDEVYICMPESSRPRDGLDIHGCVWRNCEEGRSCQFLVNGVNVGYCDFDGPFADNFGCAARPCDAPDSPCRADETCDGAAPNADARGCRMATCEEGAICPPTYACAPGADGADLRGCVFTELNGSGGSGGTAGSGGAASGGSSGSAAGNHAQGGASAGATGNAGRGGAGQSGGTAGSAGTTVTPAPGDEPSGRCVPR